MLCRNCSRLGVDRQRTRCVSWSELIQRFMCVEESAKQTLKSCGRCDTNVSAGVFGGSTHTFHPIPSGKNAAGVNPTLTCHERGRAVPRCSWRNLEFAFFCRHQHLDRTVTPKKSWKELETRYIPTKSTMKTKQATKEEAPTPTKEEDDLKKKESDGNDEAKKSSDELATVAEVFSFAKRRRTRIYIAAACFWACVSGAVLPGKFSS